MDLSVSHKLGGSRFWFWVPFLQQSSNNPVNLNGDYMTLLDFNWILGRGPKWNPVKNWIPVFNWFWQTSTFGRKSRKNPVCWITYLLLQKNRSSSLRNIMKTQHGEGEKEQVNMWCLETTVSLSPVIDRQMVSVVIVRGLCDVWSKINSVTFVTDEQNELSLCPGEDPPNLVVVRIRGLSMWLMYPHMYPRTSGPLYLKMSSRTCMWKMWSCDTQDSVNHCQLLSSNDWSIPLFVRSTVRDSLLLDVMRWDTGGGALKSWPSWVWI